MTLEQRLTNNGKWILKRVGLFCYDIETESSKIYNIHVCQFKDDFGIYQHGTRMTNLYMSKTFKKLDDALEFIREREYK